MIKPGVPVRGYGPSVNGSVICILPEKTILTLLEILPGIKAYGRMWLRVLTQSGICEIEDVYVHRLSESTNQ